MGNNCAKVFLLFQFSWMSFFIKLMQPLLRQVLSCMCATIFFVAFSAEGLASCGDWLASSEESMAQHSTRQAEPSLQLPAWSWPGDLSVDHGLQMIHGPHVDPLPFEQQLPLPCAGPQCRQAPLAPWHPVTFEVLTTPTHALWVRVVNASLITRNSGIFERSRDAIALSGFWETLERPPQRF